MMTKRSASPLAKSRYCSKRRTPTSPLSLRGRTLGCRARRRSPRAVGADDGAKLSGVQVEVAGFSRRKWMGRGDGTSFSFRFFWLWRRHRRALPKQMRQMWQLHFSTRDRGHAPKCGGRQCCVCCGVQQRAQHARILRMSYRRTGNSLRQLFAGWRERLTSGGMKRVINGQDENQITPADTRARRCRGPLSHGDRPGRLNHASDRARVNFRHAASDQARFHCAGG
jgi:hypothetical protein